MNHDYRIFALGFFDGVHIGHQALLEECCRLAQVQDCETAAITFDRHPQALFSATTPALITSLEDRYKLLLRYGIDHVYSFPVTKEVMGQHWRDFLDKLVVYGAAGFVCGYDFRFGHCGEGDAEKVRAYCREHNLPCAVVPEQTMDGIRISSTHIRGLLEQGELAQASRFLGHPHILSGEVTAGRHIGRTIGFPTANILIPNDVVMLKRGVYACNAHVDGHSYPAVTNIGSRPTVNGHQVRAESWLLDFRGDLYGKTVTLDFVHFLRPEQKFDSLEALKEQIRLDGAQAYKLLR